MKNLLAEMMKPEYRHSFEEEMKKAKREYRLKAAKSIQSACKQRIN